MSISGVNSIGAAAYAYRNSSRKATATSFVSKAAEKSTGVRSVSETGKAETVSTKDMTMEEYKQYIHDKISRIPLHPSRMQESISINISEAGFEAMKNDPEYEAWVLNDLRTGWAQPDRWAGVCGGAYSTIYYGATKEACRAQMWSAGYQNGSGKSLFDSKAKDCFWERRARETKHAEYERLAEENALKRKMLTQEMDRKYYQNKAVSIAAYEAADILNSNPRFPSQGERQIQTE